MRDLRWLARRLYPRRLRNQMIMMAILMVIIPTISIGYIVETEGRSAVLSEKEKKLSSVIALLNDALGDSFNDLHMLLWAGTGVAMGNATEEPKAVADYITDDVDHNGIWNALKHFDII